MGDEHLVHPEELAADPKTAEWTPPVDRNGRPVPAEGAKDGADNRGRRAGATPAGEVTGSGASAGGGGNPEDIDSDPQSGGGAVHPHTENAHPGTGADAPTHNSA